MRSVVAVMLALSMGSCCRGEEPDPEPQSAALPQRVCTKANLDASVRAYQDALARMNSALDDIGISDTPTQRRARRYIRLVCIEGRTLNPPGKIDGQLLCAKKRLNQHYYNSYHDEGEMVKICISSGKAK